MMHMYIHLHISSSSGIFDIKYIHSIIYFINFRNSAAEEKAGSFSRFSMNSYFPPLNQKFESNMPNLFRTLIGPQNVNDTCLRNRMKLCLVAIGLMWLTTLQNAVYLSSIVIPVPDFNTTVYSICSMTFQVSRKLSLSDLL